MFLKRLLLIAAVIAASIPVYQARANGDLPPPNLKPIPQDQLEPRLYRVTCSAGVCEVPEEVLAASELFKYNQIVEMKRLRDENNTLRTMKGCAKLEVAPKLKKERDS